MISDMQRRLLDIAQNTARLIMERYKSKRGTVIGEETYFYTHTPVTIATGVTQSVNIPIQSDSDFNAYFVSGLAFNSATGAVIANPYLLYQITDTGTGRTWLSEQAFFSSIVGNGGLPFILQNPTMLRAKSDLQLTYNNLALAAIGVTVQTVISGIKVFYAGDQ